ncbi:alpha/beta hydrolase [Mycolicibacter kumamotonensis]|uniref:Alpha/beta hydrolase n=1 Tax=Mycolicibacter kumamotonensis TaxID=354243 RepID=A0A1X0E973_9MYCO|nr:alpha/beta fold hydrolase [Mycolicibacter kumamotonensis]NDJ88049.1 alpha/beta hydrolase [Mycolicibacter kumamotonensis]ORA80550.1 alpha/beta hydrolase [Mycolicibacter kumamotonensis]
MSSAVRPRMVNAGGVPMSALLAEVAEPRAVVVALHGGGTTSAYFDCPGQPHLSLLRTGAALGYTVIGLDRPGYGASALYPEAMEDPEQRVRLAYLAVDRILGDRDRGAGLFVVGHSNGCELGLRMAADDRGAELLGLELAGTGLHYQPAAQNVLSAARPDQRPVGLRELLWEPASLYPDGVRGITNASPGATYEAAMVTGWPQRDFPALAGRVRVPVRFSFAEHEKIWQSDSAARREIREIFTAAPSFTSNEEPGSGHNLSVGFGAERYHRSVLSFVEECAATAGAAQDSEVG